jgi:hypothetical protein
MIGMGVREDDLGDAPRIHAHDRKVFGQSTGRRLKVASRTGIDEDQIGAGFDQRNVCLEGCAGRVASDPRK